jgi:steroid delta-isomerase-like uncharacterized protein
LIECNKTISQLVIERIQVEAPDQNKQLVRRYYEELFNEGRLDVIDELFSGDFLDHEAVAGVPRGREGMADVVTMWRSGFSDFREEVCDLVAEGDRVAARFQFSGIHTGSFLGVAPTGRFVEMTGIEIFRVEDGRIAELWYAEQLYDLLTELRAVSA